MTALQISVLGRDSEGSVVSDTVTVEVADAPVPVPPPAPGVPDLPGPALFPGLDAVAGTPDQPGPVPPQE